MHEIEEEFGKGAVVESPDKEPYSNFSLADIYGRYTHPPDQEFEIDLPTFQLLSSQDRTVYEQTKAAVVKKFGIPSLSSWGNGGHEGRNFVVTPGPTKPLGFWVPQFMERILLTGLAKGLAARKDEPLVVEVEGGTGAISKMLARESWIKSIVQGKDEVLLNSFRLDNTDVRVFAGDVWDLGKQWGPQYPEGVANNVDQQLGYLAKAQRTVSSDEYHTVRRTKDQEIAFSRMWYLAKHAVKEMQGLNLQRSEESPVDVVIYSAGLGNPDGLTTVAIRDAIHPKAIIYQRYPEGLRPIPQDWKEKFNQSHISDNTFDSTDPGQHYRTVAVWRTFSRKNWDAHNYGHWWGVSELNTEIIVQLRKDVKLTNVPIGSAREYPFDKEILALLDKSGKASKFLQGINDAREQLLTSQ